MRTAPPGHDVLIYDGACGLCRRAAGRLLPSLPATTATTSFRDPGALSRFPGIDAARCEAALQFVRKDGVVFSGMEAAVEALRGRWFGPLLRAYYLPGIRPLLDAAYRAVARRRFHPSIVGLSGAGPPSANAGPAPVRSLSRSRR